MTSTKTLEATAKASDRETWMLDAAHSSAAFQIRHLVIAKVRGTIGGLQASLEWDGESVESAVVNASLDPATIATGDEKRDAHLRSADFFDVESFPAISFASRGITSKGKGAFDVEGDLTLHGVTRHVVLAAEWVGRATDPWGNARVAVAATAAINRKEFGLTWNQALETGGVLVGDAVTIDLDLQFVAPAKA